MSTAEKHTEDGVQNVQYRKLGMILSLLGILSLGLVIPVALIAQYV